MKLLLDTRLTFIAGVLTLLLSVGASALSATPVGLIGGCLIGVVLGALRSPSFAVYSGGIVSALAFFSVVGLLTGDELSAAMIMIPFIFSVLFLYAGAAFILGRVGVTLWRRITGHSTRTR